MNLTKLAAELTKIAASLNSKSSKTAGSTQTMYEYQDKDGKIFYLFEKPVKAYSPWDKSTSRWTRKRYRVVLPPAIVESVEGSTEQ